MSITHIAALLIFLLTAGCTGVERAAPHAPPPAGVTPGEIVATEPSVGRAARQDTAQTDASASKPPMPVSPSPAPAPPQARKGDATRGSGKPTATPPLDLPLLEKRLRETEAIGVFTKIALKNQVDDLLKKFRAYYQGRSRTTLAELRQPYDMLLLKVLSLLQDGDPGLARAIVASREVIWGMLADPDKFATL